MRRLMTIAGALCVVLWPAPVLLRKCLPADPNNPNENVPEASSPPPYGVPIDLATAKKAAEERGRSGKRKWDAFCIAVVGPSGDLVYFGSWIIQFASIRFAAQGARVGALSSSDAGV